ncbi:MAG: substrate-binding domain-containing protein [Pseudomonadota bacterium]
MAPEIIEIVLPIALKEVYDIVTPSFTAETGHELSVALMLNPEVPGYIANGASWSIALSNPSYIRKIVDAGGCSRDGLIDLGSSPLCLAVRGDSTEFPLRDPEEIAAFLVEAETIAITASGTSGAQFAKLTNSLNITEKMREKLRPMPGGGPMTSLQNGEVGVAALPLTNVAPVPGVFAKFICPLEMGVHIDLAYCVAAHANTATRHFSDWLMEPERVAQLADLGLIGQVSTV